MVKYVLLHSVVLIVYGVGFILASAMFQMANDRIDAIESNVNPELIHTCNLYDDKRRKICGWIEVE
jgi:hypothetical protein